MTKIVSWNIGKRYQPWLELLEMDADVALLQEVGSVPREVAGRVETGNEEHYGWNPGLYDRWPMVVKLSSGVKVEWFRQTNSAADVSKNEFDVSYAGTIAGARITPLDEGPPFLVFSMYARWLPLSETDRRRQYIYADASAHRIISDFSAFIDHPNPASHRILAAGDLNIIYGATSEHALVPYPERDRSVFQRMQAVGLEFMGPQYPNGRMANPGPVGLPEDTRNVPTYYTSRQTKETAQNQLDYVFASRGFHHSIRVKALNNVDEWGSSDHCKLVVDVHPEQAP